METELNLNQHISKRYNAELENLRGEVVKMGTLVENQVLSVVKALSKKDVELAKKVITQDNKVNEFDLKIDELSAQILAKRQPAASDLRLIIAILKSITDLERIGDLSLSVAYNTQDLCKKKVSDEQLIELVSLGKLTKNMIKNTMDAFVRLDIEKSFETITKDKRINHAYDALSRQMLTYILEDHRNIKNSLHVINTAKSFERIGDHCKNICEHIIYVVKGEDIRYRNIDEIRDIILDKKENDE